MTSLAVKEILPQRILLRLQTNFLTGTMFLQQNLELCTMDVTKPQIHKPNGAKPEILKPKSAKPEILLQQSCPDKDMYFCEITASDVEITASDVKILLEKIPFVKRWRYCETLLAKCRFSCKFLC